MFINFYKFLPANKEGASRANISVDRDKTRNPAANTLSACLSQRFETFSGVWVISHSPLLCPHPPAEIKRQYSCLFVSTVPSVQLHL